jgi:hypothetical protein
MTVRSKALMWTGIGLCGAGAAGLVVGGVLDVEAADPWASVTGGVATLIGLALTIYALFTQPAPSAAPSVTAGGERSVAAGGNIGSAATGNGTTAASPPPMTSSAPPPGGTVTASGDRSVAAGGDIGSVSTGDA